MSTLELRKRLIEKIQKIQDKRILEEAYRLFELESEDLEIYKLSEEQKIVVNEARQQIKRGQFLTNEQADNEVDEWLSK